MAGEKTTCRPAASLALIVAAESVGAVTYTCSKGTTLAVAVAVAAARPSKSAPCDAVLSDGTTSEYLPVEGAKVMNGFSAIDGVDASEVTGDAPAALASSRPQ